MLNNETERRLARIEQYLHQFTEASELCLNAVDESRAAIATLAAAQQLQMDHETEYVSFFILFSNVIFIYPIARI